MAPRPLATCCLIGALALVAAPSGGDDGGRTCALRLGVGPRAGGTLNGDQWIAGAHSRLGLRCLGGFGSELSGVTGFGGNHLTLRGSLRAVYDVELSGGERGLGFYPALGWSPQYFHPVGHFGEWCDRYDVDACSGFASGLELGGGARYGWWGLEAIVGLHDLPVLTLSATATFDVLGDVRLGRRPR